MLLTKLWNKSKIISKGLLCCRCCLCSFQISPKFVEIILLFEGDDLFAERSRLVHERLVRMDPPLPGRVAGAGSNAGSHTMSEEDSDSAIYSMGWCRSSVGSLPDGKDSKTTVFLIQVSFITFFVNTVFTLFTIHLRVMTTHMRGSPPEDQRRSSANTSRLLVIN